MQIEELDEECLACIELVRDGTNTIPGKFIGLYGIPQRGGRWWYANNGTSGYCCTEEEARASILAQPFKPNEIR